MVCSTFFGHLKSSITAAIVDHEVFDGGDARDLARQIRQRLRQGVFLVKAGDLDEEFQVGDQFLSCEGNLGEFHAVQRGVTSLAFKRVVHLVDALLSGDSLQHGQVFRVVAVGTGDVAFGGTRGTADLI